jgi:hypothetical protein
MSRSHSQLLRENDDLSRKYGAIWNVLVEVQRSWLGRWIVNRAVKKLKGEM